MPNDSKGDPQDRFSIPLIINSSLLEKKEKYPLFSLKKQQQNILSRTMSLVEFMQHQKNSRILFKSIHKYIQRIPKKALKKYNIFILGL